MPIAAARDIPNMQRLNGIPIQQKFIQHSVSDFALYVTDFSTNGYFNRLLEKGSSSGTITRVIVLLHCYFNGVSNSFLISFAVAEGGYRLFSWLYEKIEAKYLPRRFKKLKSSFDTAVKFVARNIFGQKYVTPGFFSSLIVRVTQSDYLRGKLKEWLNFFYLSDAFNLIKKGFGVEKDLVDFALQNPASQGILGFITFLLVDNLIRAVVFGLRRMLRLTRFYHFQSRMIVNPTTIPRYREFTGQFKKFQMKTQSDYLVDNNSEYTNDKNTKIEKDLYAFAVNPLRIKTYANLTRNSYLNKVLEDVELTFVDEENIKALFIQQETNKKCLLVLVVGSKINKTDENKEDTDKNKKDTDKKKKDKDSDIKLNTFKYLQEKESKIAEKLKSVFLDFQSFEMNFNGVNLLQEEKPEIAIDFEQPEKINQLMALGFFGDLVIKKDKLPLRKFFEPRKITAFDPTGLFFSFPSDILIVSREECKDKLIYCDPQLTIPSLGSFDAIFWPSNDNRLTKIQKNEPRSGIFQKDAKSTFFQQSKINSGSVEMDKKAQINNNFLFFLQKNYNKEEEFDPNVVPEFIRHTLIKITESTHAMILFYHKIMHELAGPLFTNTNIIKDNMTELNIKNSFDAIFEEQRAEKNNYLTTLVKQTMALRLFTILYISKATENAPNDNAQNYTIQSLERIFNQKIEQQEEFKNPHMVAFMTKLRNFQQSYRQHNVVLQSLPIQLAEREDFQD